MERGEEKGLHAYFKGQGLTKKVMFEPDLKEEVKECARWIPEGTALEAEGIARTNSLREECIYCVLVQQGVKCSWSRTRDIVREIMRSQMVEGSVGHCREFCFYLNEVRNK